MSTLLHKAGYVSADRRRDIEVLRERQAAAARQDAAKTYERNCGVWPRYANARLDDLRLPRAVLTAEEFDRYVYISDQLRTLLEAPSMLVLSGANGPGKTHLASALVLEFCRKGLEAKFTTAGDFFLAIKSTFGERGRTQEDLIQRFRRYELLVIDEIEVRSESNWENWLLRDLVNARYSCCRSTVIITNKHKSEINGTAGEAYFSTAIRDRIRDDDGAILVCDWPSLRGRVRL